MIDLQKLRRLAEQATQGEWIVYQQGNSVPSHCIKSKGAEFGAGLTNVCGAISPKTGNADYIAALNPTAFIEILDRLDAAEKVCELIEQNMGGHYCVVSKCENCHTEEVGNAGDVCWKCITDALKKWQGWSSMVADEVESCESCKLLDKTKYETKHGFCEFKRAKRRYSSWICFKFMPENAEKEAQ